MEIPRNNSFIKKLIFIIVFFTITPIALFSSVLSLIALSNNEIVKTKNSNSNIFELPKPGIQVYASLPSNIPSIKEEIIEADARPEIIHQYLKENESALLPYANLIVQTADKYNLDFRLIVAIAQKESGLCRVIPDESYNCWGWGIHSQGTLKFDSYEEGIETVSKGLKEYYIDEGYITVEEIMKKYAHPSSTTWAEGVSYYMNEM